MKIYREDSLRNFEFWSGAVSRAEVFTPEQMDEIESILEMDYPDGIDETTINDMFWFEEDMLAEWLGFADFEGLERHNNGEEEDEEEE